MLILFQTIIIIINNKLTSIIGSVKKIRRFLQSTVIHRTPLDTSDPVAGFGPRPCGSNVKIFVSMDGRYTSQMFVENRLPNQEIKLVKRIKNSS